MLKGDVFAEQVFENQIFALFINTFLDGHNGIINGYKNNMLITSSGSNLTIASGAVCIQGRFLEEATTSTVQVSATNSYHSLVIEIDLDKVNTATNFTQAYYKVLTGTSGYPSLTQTDIVKNNAGIYQFELARFRTNAQGNVTNITRTGTSLDFESIYSAITASVSALLNNLNADATTLIDNLRTEIANVEDSSEFIMKSTIKSVEKNVTPTQRDGKYYVSTSINLPSGYTTNNTIVLKAELVEDTGVIGDNLITFFPVYDYIKIDNEPYIDIETEATAETYKVKLTIMRV